MFDFLDNHLHLPGPRLIPYRYFYLTLASHFYQNASPNYAFLKRYFWYYSFHSEDLLTNTTQTRQQVDLLHRARTGMPDLGRFLIDRNRLRSASYSTQGRVSSAILCLLANQVPRDWAQPDREVLTDVYYVLTNRPNLHHVFPMAYVERVAEDDRLSANSLMNIVYLTQMTNIKIGDKNPIQYVRDLDKPGFTETLKTHLVPPDLLQWARQDEMPEDALDRFIDSRIDLMIGDLRKKLAGVTFDVIDTREKA